MKVITIKRFVFIIFFCIEFFNSDKLRGSDFLYGIRNFYRQYDFVKIDCSNDSLQVLNQLSDFYYTPNFSACYNSLHQKYYYSSGQTIKVLDANTGALDTTYDFSNIHPNFLLHTVFNPNDSCIYGIKSNIGTYVQSFSKFDPATGILSDISQINAIDNIHVGCKSAIDPYLGEYYLQSRNITTIRIADGIVLNDQIIQKPLNEWLDHLAYSCDQRRFFGLSNNYHTTQNYFSELSNSNGVSNHINASPLPTNFYKQYMSGSTINNTSDIYYFSTALGKIYGVDINTGVVVYNHEFGSEYQFLFLESGSTFDCTILNVNEADNNKFTLYPNPTSQNIRIQYELRSNSELLIFDQLGREIFKTILVADENEMVINISGYESGIYLCRIAGNIYSQPVKFSVVH